MTETPNTVDLIAEAIQHGIHQGNNAYQIAQEVLDKLGSVVTPGDPNQSKTKSGQDFVFSDEQVERVARAIWTLEESGELDVPTASSRREMLRYYQHLARAALKVAGVTPRPEVAEDRAEAMRDEFRSYLGEEVYVCSRDHSAWSHGTMGLDDFSLAAEDDEIIESLVQIATAAAVTPQPGCCMDDTNVLDASMTQMDEAALAEVVAKALCTIDTYPGLAGQHAANGLIIARAVAAWLKDGGR